jgi:hypothetical protein
MESPDTLLDPGASGVVGAEVRVEFGMARAEVALRSASAAHAEQLAAIDATLREARAYPEVFVGPLAHAYDSEAIEFAERAAVADLAVRLGLAEQTVRAQAHEAEVLLHRCPRVWSAFREGDVPAPNARTVAELVDTLPTEAWAAFEKGVLAAAATLAPARFRAMARNARERLMPEEAAERHERRAQERRVFVDADLDGMCWLTAYLPAETAHAAMTRIDNAARSLAAHPDETRTLAQLRADIAGDLLVGVLGGTMSGPSGGISVAVTVPVMTLLGHGEQPGYLDGYGPIDAETARRLAGHAPSFTRLLTHPVTGAVLDVDRTSYRVPADLKKWLAVRDGGCTFPGCGRSTRDCDLDHTTAWDDGGTTSAENLAHLCRHHHRLKHHSSWEVRHTVLGIEWTSPTGAIRNADPPPF